MLRVWSIFGVFSTFKSTTALHIIILYYRFKCICIYLNDSQCVYFSPRISYHYGNDFVSEPFVRPLIGIIVFCDRGTSVDQPNRKAKTGNHGRPIGVIYFVYYYLYAFPSYLYRPVRLFVRFFFFHTYYTLLIFF